MLKQNNQRNVKRNNNKNRRGRNNNNPSSMLLTRGVVPLCRFPLKKRINLQYSIYAVYSYPSSTSFYSFSNSTSQTLPTFVQNLFADYVTSTEYTAFAAQYAFQKISGVEMKISPSFLNSSAIIDAPSAFLNMTNLTSTSSLTQSGVARSDNSIEVKLTNQSLDSQVVYFQFPGVYIGSAGTPQFGSDAWLTTRTATSDSLLYLLLGSYAGPQFTSLAATTVNRVAIIDVVFDVTFAAPVINA
jgi:hypothetical protein